MFKSPLATMRVVGTMETISFLVLLLIAMPLKYFADFPEAVFWAGSAHGFLFVLYVLTVLLALIARKISFLMAVLAVIAAFIPFGPYFIDRKVSS